jgi:hypothetical protein
MGRALVVLASGCVQLVASRLSRRSTSRATDVPRTARMLGQRGSVEDWKAGNDRATTVMTWIGAVMVVLGIGLAVASILA